jgi:D-alanyl-D-alanine carboxypeptidase
MISIARRLVRLGACLCSAALMTAAQPALAQIPYSALSVPAPASTGRSSQIVVDAATGEVLYEVNADAPRYPASITKVMTLYLAFEALAEGRLQLTDSVPVSSRAAAQPPTKLGLRAGESLSVDDALRAISVKSSNDIALAMAERLGGSEERFAALMTVRAQELGMSNTRFVNASGLPDTRQITTARDISVLSRAIMRDYPQYYSYFGQKYFSFRGQSIANHNGLLHSMPGVDGIKTGFTSAAGYNLSASAVRDGRRLIAVVLAGSSRVARNSRVQNLLDTGFVVAERREHGESVTLAMALNEQSSSTIRLASADKPRDNSFLTRSPSGIVVKPVVLARAASVTPPKPAAAVAKPIVLASAAPAKPAEPPVALRGSQPRKSDVKPSGSDSWLVQVGAFRGRAQASAQITFVQRKFAELFAEADGFVEDATDRQYRARFSGMTAAEAQKACKSLSAQRQPCMVVGPAKPSKR